MSESRLNTMGNKYDESVIEKLNKANIINYSMEEITDNLQYPLDDLGNDEYNNFILFSIYDDVSPEVSDAQQAITAAKEYLGNNNISEIKERMRSWNNNMIPEKDLNRLDGNEFDLYDLYGSGEEGNTLERYIKILNSGNNIDNPLSTAADLALATTSVYTANSTSLDNAFKQFNTYSQERVNQFINDRSRSTTTYAQSLGLEITPRSGTRTSAGRLKLQQKLNKIERTIALYLPPKLVNNGNISYDGVNFQLIQGIVGAIQYGDFTGLNTIARRYVTNIMNTVTSFVGIDANIPEALQAVSGLAINPRKEMLFNGVETRGFDFTFTFTPRSQKEAIIVSNIIRTFRKYAHPSLSPVSTAGTVISTPAEFDIKYYKVINPGESNEVVVENLFLNKIGRCVLTSIDVDYTPNNIPSMFEDGSPTRTLLTMKFQELRPLLRQDIEEGY